MGGTHVGHKGVIENKPYALLLRQIYTGEVCQRDAHRLEDRPIILNPTAGYRANCVTANRTY